MPGRPADPGAAADDLPPHGALHLRIARGSRPTCIASTTMGRTHASTVILFTGMAVFIVAMIVTPPAEILAALDMIPDLARSDMLRAYGKLILSERLFRALMELPIELRKEWLLMLNEKNGA
ncbi:hypothetical protein EJB05_08803, partial [Eragrostis curvula]